MVCLLKKALYGLKQSPRFERFTKEHNFIRIYQSQGDHTLFIKYSIIGKLTLLLVCVDDVILARYDEIEKLNLKEKLATKNEKVVYSKKEIFISQRKYVLNLLNG